MEKPESLIAAVHLSSHPAGLQSRSIVSSNFLIAEALRPSANGWRIAEKFDRDETAGIIRTNGTHNQESLWLLNTAQAKSVVHANGSGSQIQRVIGPVGDPIFLKLNKLLRAIHHLMNIKSGNTKLFMASIHASEVLVNAEQLNAIIYSLVRFSTLEALNWVVQSSVFGHELEWFIRHNLGPLPTTIVIIVINFEHVVGCDATKGVLMVWAWFGAQLFRFMNRNVWSHESLLIGACHIVGPSGSSCQRSCSDRVKGL